MIFRYILMIVICAHLYGKEVPISNLAESLTDAFPTKNIDLVYGEFAKRYEEYLKSWSTVHLEIRSQDAERSRYAFYAFVWHVGTSMRACIYDREKSDFIQKKLCDAVARELQTGISADGDDRQIVFDALAYGLSATFRVSGNGGPTNDLATSLISNLKVAKNTSLVRFVVKFIGHSGEVMMNMDKKDRDMIIGYFENMAGDSNEVVTAYDYIKTENDIIDDGSVDSLITLLTRIRSDPGQSRIIYSRIANIARVCLALNNRAAFRMAAMDNKSISNRSDRGCLISMMINNMASRNIDLRVALKQEAIDVERCLVTLEEDLEDSQDKLISQCIRNATDRLRALQSGEK
jgi:hypothetical protein